MNPLTKIKLKKKLVKLKNTNFREIKDLRIPNLGKIIVKVIENMFLEIVMFGVVKSCYNCVLYSERNLEAMVSINVVAAFSMVIS